MESNCVNTRTPTQEEHWVVCIRTEQRIASKCHRVISHGGDEGQFIGEGEGLGQVVHSVKCDVEVDIE